MLVLGVGVGMKIVSVYMKGLPWGLVELGTLETALCCTLSTMEAKFYHHT